MPAEGPMLAVAVAFSPCAGVVDEVSLRLPEGATVGDAVLASGLQARHPDVDLSALPVGVWGALRPLDARVRDRDRVELYRPLSVDPKEARRRRHRATLAPAGPKRTR